MSIRKLTYILTLIAISAFQFALIAGTDYGILAGIKIIGNDNFNRKEIIAWTGLKTGEILTEVKLNQAVNGIINGYEDNGWYFASIDSIEKNINSDNTSVELVIYIYEGAFLKLQEVSVKDSSEDTVPQFTGNFRKSSRFYKSDLDYGIEKSLDQTEIMGYPFSIFTLSDMALKNSGEYQNLSLKFDLQYGPQVFLSGVEVKGNNSVRDNVIIRETRIKAGDVFNPEAFSKAKKYLMKTGLLKDVKPLRIVMRQDKYFALVEVKESRYNSLDGVIGYLPGTADAQGFWTGLADISFNNLFGTGRKFRLFWEQPAENSQDLSISYREPWIGGIPLDMEAVVKQSIKASSIYIISDSKDRYITRTFELNGYFPLNESLEITGGVSQNEVLPDSIARYVNNIPHSLSNGVKGGLIIDTRDNRLNPRGGIMFKNISLLSDKKNYVGSGSTIPENVQERRLEIDLESAVNPVGNSVIDIHFGGKHLTSGQEEIPISEMYFLGGTKNLRGYREDQFAGTSIAWINLEYRYLFEKYSRFFLFADWGYHYRRLPENSPGLSSENSRHFGYGLGIRLQTDVGVLGLDYGLGEGDSLMEGKIHIRIRNDF